VAANSAMRLVIAGAGRRMGSALIRVIAVTRQGIAVLAQRSSYRYTLQKELSGELNAVRSTAPEIDIWLIRTSLKKSGRCPSNKTGVLGTLLARPRFWLTRTRTGTAPGWSRGTSGIHRAGRPGFCGVCKRGVVIKAARGRPSRPLFRVWSEDCDAPWPKLLDCWGHRKPPDDYSEHSLCKIRE
jgi:hypothetical protein